MVNNSVLKCGNSTMARGRALATPSLPALRQAVNAKRMAHAGRVQTTMGATGKFVVGGNWKCNGTIDSVKQLVSALNAGSITADVEVICAPPMVHVGLVCGTLESPFQVAVQNCWDGPGGAFTGEVSAEMIADAGIPWVIIGHSERRTLCGETSELVAKKVKYAIDHGLNVMACIGETLAEREAGRTMEVCYSQLAPIAAALTENDWSHVVIAYEPVWAIGTGKVATPAQAQDVHAGVRGWLNNNVSPAVASATRIQYGGSVNAGNCEELASQPDIDGFLVGGASLNGPDFITICNAARMSVVA
eukprot:CAMPEP_0118933886 /NCGR_PEP_ID=MMETSP1169-20130426/12837_1 /TAXON_ID=36882 /ORGANISM="Pyramimonas obovata, Strain CCMP722" /LENGTH=303 /DNA_ID=CAMNT_0006876713 /DNA_START=73 /DNA_END=984 /DNA_ORIENTATION=-